MTLWRLPKRSLATRIVTISYRHWKCISFYNIKRGDEKVARVVVRHVTLLRLSSYIKLPCPMRLQYHQDCKTKT